MTLVGTIPTYSGEEPRVAADADEADCVSLVALGASLALCKLPEFHGRLSC